MLTKLVVCPRCKRHVRQPADACPFCGASRTAHAVTLGVVAVAVAAMAGCSSSDSSPVVADDASTGADAVADATTDADAATDVIIDDAAQDALQDSQATLYKGPPQVFG